MANREQLAILKRSISDWNEWRYTNLPAYSPDLREADLSQAFLIEANLKKVNLMGAIVTRARLYRADLREADLSAADLADAQALEVNMSEANLSKANLHGADLRKSNLRGTNFSDANLNTADLSEADLREANLNGAHFSKSRIGLTILGKVDLGRADGLEKTRHWAPSYISTDTIQLSRGKIPEAFLRGCGLSDADIEYAKLYNPELNNEEINTILYKIYDLQARQTIQISPLFISYSRDDGAFVDKLERYLNMKGIRFWRDIHHATAGRLEKQIDRAIRQNPTVLLILSEHSVKSDWVEHEVRTAHELEKELRRDAFCPIALDDSWKSTRWPKRVMNQIMEYNILDFSDWKNDSKFRNMFRKLIDGLELFYKG